MAALALADVSVTRQKPIAASTTEHGNGHDGRLHHGGKAAPGGQSPGLSLPPHYGNRGSVGGLSAVARTRISWLVHRCTSPPLIKNQRPLSRVLIVSVLCTCLARPEASQMHFCATRSLAERARGLRAISSAVGTMGLRFTISSTGGFAAHAHRQVRRAGAAVGKRGEGLFHDAVFQRVIADDRDAPLRIQPAYRRVETATQHGKLRVDFYAQGLERALGGMPPRTSSGRGNGRLYHLHQLVARRERLALARLHDKGGDAGGPVFVRVVADGPSEDLLRCRC